MATIGTFTKSENGFTGTVKTLSLNVKTVKFVPAEGDSERGPDFRIFAGATDFGAAWKKTARETQREYLSVKLDDPSFPAPIYASLVEAEGGEGSVLDSRRSPCEGDWTHPHQVEDEEQRPTDVLRQPHMPKGRKGQADHELEEHQQCQ